MSRLQKALFLSDKGYTDLKKAIFACLTIDFPSIITLKPIESDIPIVTDTR